MNNDLRSVICEWIAATATDDELLQLAASIKDRKQHETKLVTDVAGFMGVNAFTGKKREPLPTAVTKVATETVHELLPAPVEPPGVAASKIANETIEKIRNHLMVGPETINGIASLIKRPVKQAEPVMKLLWERKIVTYDGEKFKIRM